MNTWIIAPYNSKTPYVFEEAWKFNLENNFISLGWHELGDIFMLTSKIPRFSYFSLSLSEN